MNGYFLQVAARRRHLFSLLLALTLPFLPAPAQNQPHIEKKGGVAHLVVQGKPYLAIAGETGNSASGSAAYMESLWPRLRQLNLNTVLVPVSWEMVEPQEGTFDFSIVDALVRQARREEVKLSLLWFGSWKNMVSSYAPSWVKLNRERFPLLQDKNGGQIQMLSVFSEGNVAADARAFSAMMRHIREIDAAEQTVIMVQVENEVGYSFGERDWSDLARRAWKAPVPRELTDYLRKHRRDLIPEFRSHWESLGARTSGSWAGVFGDSPAGNEIFMSYYYAKYIGAVVAAGKKEYDIPMFANASIGRQDRKIATYPCGGPIPFVMDVWQCAAPQLDAISPDIYYGDFEGHCRAYTQKGNPLIIPETRGDEVGIGRALLAYAEHGALCFSPFGIEGYAGGPICDFYRDLSTLAPLMLEREPGMTMRAIMVDSDTPVKTLEMGKYRILCEFGHRGNQPAGEQVGYALILQAGEDSFYVYGKGVSLQFSLLERGKKNLVTGILECEEGCFENGAWKASRRLNGDQIMNDYSFDSAFLDGRSGNGLRFGRTGLQYVKLYHY